MLIPSYCSGAMVMITSLSRRVNANFECWNAWVDLADLAVMAAAGMALARLCLTVYRRMFRLRLWLEWRILRLRHCMPLPLHCHFIGAWRGLKTKMMNPA